MTISGEAWRKYILALAKVDSAATSQMQKFFSQYGTFNPDNAEEMKLLVNYAYGISTKYGEAAAELACQMYDACGLASGMFLEPAVPADVADYTEVAKTVYGTAKKTQNVERMTAAVTRLVKRAGQDTTLKNARRDGAQFAWVPNGDTCAYCIALASRGWQDTYQSVEKGGHAEHIHSNCDCAYAVRFNTSTRVDGYDPDKYLKMYEAGADVPYINEDNSHPKNDALWRKRLNGMRRKAYAETKSRVANLTPEQQSAILNSSIADEIRV